MTKTILVLAANPKNTSPLRLDEEVREIDNGLQRSHRRDDFILRQKWATRPVDVRRAMLDFKPNIVHFCGHGSGKEGIAFEDEMGQAKLVNSEVLAGFFELFADKVECVVLNACYSHEQAEAIANYIPYVIGMKQEIGDTAAIEFAVAFYDALGAGRSIEFAYKLACNAIQWAGMSENLTPILKSKSSRLNKGKSSEENLIQLSLTPKLPFLLLLDVSGSMNGEPIHLLNLDLQSFINDLKSDSFTTERVDLALITFGSYASTIRDFASIYNFHLPKLEASGSTAMGEAIELGLNLIEQRKGEYKSQGIAYYKPIVLLITDGSPTDSWQTSVNRLHKESSLRKLQFIAVGLEGADMNILARISPPEFPPVSLKNLRFSKMFNWISSSVNSASRQNMKEQIMLPPPNNFEVDL